VGFGKKKILKAQLRSGKGKKKKKKWMSGQSGNCRFGRELSTEKNAIRENRESEKKKIGGGRKKVFRKGKWLTRKTGGGEREFPKRSSTASEV